MLRAAQTIDANPVIDTFSRSAGWPFYTLLTGVPAGTTRITVRATGVYGTLGRRERRARRPGRRRHLRQHRHRRRARALLAPVGHRLPRQRPLRPRHQRPLPRDAAHVLGRVGQRPRPVRRVGLERRRGPLRRARRCPAASARSRPGSAPTRRRPHPPLRRLRASTSRSARSSPPGSASRSPRDDHRRLTDARWHHVAVTYAGGTLTRVPRRRAARHAPRPRSTDRPHGRPARRPHPRRRQRRLRRARVYPRALDAAAVAAHFAASGNARPAAPTGRCGSRPRRQRDRAVLGRAPRARRPRDRTSSTTTCSRPARAACCARPAPPTATPPASRDRPRARRRTS